MKTLGHLNTSARTATALPLEPNRQRAPFPQNVGRNGPENTQHARGKLVFVVKRNGYRSQAPATRGGQKQTLARYFADQQQHSKDYSNKRKCLLFTPFGRPFPRRTDPLRTDVQC